MSNKFKHIGLFEGIGGFSLAARWAGWETVAWCEWNEFGQKVLRHHFPEAEGYGDITKTNFKKYANTIDVLTGGFPCQPFSTAGKRKGKEDERHLWPEMLRAIKEIQPRWVVGENVYGLINWNGGMVFNEVQADLEAAGYEVFPYVLPAAAVNAPHRRDRVWFVAHANNTRTNERVQFNGERKKNDEQWRGQSQSKYRENGINGIIAHTNGTKQGNDIRENIGQERKIWRGEKGDVFGELRSNGNVADTDGIRRNKNEWRIDRESEVINQNGEARDVLHTNNTIKQREYIRQKREGQFDRSDSRIGINNFENFPTQSPICGGDDGISYKLDSITFSKWRGESIKAYGNAIVPQVAYEIFKVINQMNENDAF